MLRRSCAWNTSTTGCRVSAIVARGSRGCCPTARRIRSRTASRSTAARSIGSKRATACWCHGRASRSRVASISNGGSRSGPTSARANGREPAWFETGLLDAAEWVAEWIEPHEPVRADAGARPAYVLRQRFVLDSLAPDARLYATAHGCYETFLNGQRVGDLELTPGFTSYESRLDVQTYDVTDLLVAGENIWTVGAERRLVPRTHRVRAGARQLRRHRRVPRSAARRRHRRRHR